MKIEIKVPAVGESITEATIAEWNKAQGDRVERNEVLLTLETDKASVEVVAEQAGQLSIQASAGQTVQVGSIIGTIDTEVTSVATATPPHQPPPAPDSTVPLSPAVRKLVTENQLNPTDLGTGSGKGGRLTKGDVFKTLNAPSAPATPPSRPSPLSPPSPLPSPLPSSSSSSTDQIRRTPMSKLRQTIARRLVEAQQTAAILTTFNEIDMSSVMALRAKYKDNFKEKYGVNLGFMGFFVKAAVAALKAFPQVNAEIDGTDILLKDFIHMGIAVSTEKGLLVPVIRHADQLSIAEIELAIRNYALKAREGKISLDDLADGTFTISNGGVFGSLMSTPILNPPQSGILGLHKIEDRVVVIDGKMEIRPMMYVALSYDHRMVDGRESVSFLVKIKEGLEDPSRLLLDI